MNICKLSLIRYHVKGNRQHICSCCEVWLNIKVYEYQLTLGTSHLEDTGGTAGPPSLSLGGGLPSYFCLVISCDSLMIQSDIRVREVWLHFDWPAERMLSRQPIRALAVMTHLVIVRPALPAGRQTDVSPVSQSQALHHFVPLIILIDLDDDIITCGHHLTEEILRNLSLSLL